MLLLAGVTGWLPARWNSGDAETIRLVKETPVNCVLIEPANWSEAFARKAEEEGIAVLGVARPGGDLGALIGKAASSKLKGLVLEGDFAADQRQEARKRLAAGGMALIELPPRTGLKVDAGDPVIGTSQGVWPGINPADDGSAKAAPTGAPWIDTNAGFLRFLRAATGATVWIGNLPPAKTVIPVARYYQAIGDAAMVGARWVVALDADFDKRLLGGDAAALDDWRKIGKHLRYWEERWGDRAYKPYRGLAIIQGVDDGALLSGGILDMVAARHTPIRAVPIPVLNDESIKGAMMAVSVDPSAVTAEQKEALRRFTRSGGSLLSGPPGWKFPPMHPGQVTVQKEEVTRLDKIWQGVNSMVGRENLGARLFNVSSMLCELVSGPGDRPVILHLVNYADHPTELVTVHLVEKVQTATLYSPDGPPQEVEVYPQDKGSGIDIEKVGAVATLVLE
ncbi:MAG: hypothetical protein KIT09_03265 [Bryobacteraceae bacterium]|nr:hypothetical protein [Bryobacteraceae bacterium]